MEKIDSMSQCWCSNHLSAENSKWLEQNCEKMEQSLRQMLKLIGEHVESSSQMHSLDLHLQEFNTIYQSLAQRYHHLTAELCKNLPQHYCQTSSSTPDYQSGKYHHASPQQEMGLHKSDATLITSSADSSSLLSDTDSENSFGSSVNIYLDSPIKNIHNDQKMITDLQDLTISYPKLHQLYEGEDVSCRLRSHHDDKSECVNYVLAVDPELENKLLLQLRIHITHLESQLTASKSEISRLMEELDVRKETLESSDEEITKLKHELSAEEGVAMLKTLLDSERLQVTELTEKVARYSNDLSARDSKIEGLEGALREAQEKLAQLQSDIAILSEKQTLTFAELNESELRGKLLGEKIMQSEAEKMEMKRLRDAQEIGLQGQINELKAEVCGRGEHVEALNRNLDGLKLKYDMLMAQTDEMNGTVSTLMAEVSCRDKQIVQKEERLGQLISLAESSGKQVDELKQRVYELEKQVEWQTSMIRDEAEKKREAMRQLCFSLEHYRSGYKQVCQAFLKLANGVLA